MNKLYLLLTLIITLYINNIHSYTIFMIRHGEKIDDNHVGLSSKGEIRAKCISKKFNNYNIKKIYAQDYNKKTKKRIRAYLTVEPLANKIKLKVDTLCDRDDIDCITNKLIKNYKKGNIFISWEHDNLQKIAEKLLKKLKINYDKDKLNSSNKGYDFLWKIENKKLIITKEGC